MLNLALGVKSDPILYRYSYGWLFRLMADEGVDRLQLGSFFEFYQLADSFFVRLRDQARDFGIRIDSTFTAHRELGGLLHEDPEYHLVARRNLERSIEIGALLGVRSVGHNPGAILRDRMGTKSAAWRRYVTALIELAAFAHTRGIERLAIEPMSCLAEPPTLPEEIRALGEELAAYRRRHPETAAAGYCVDIAHGYADQEKVVRSDHWELMTAALPWTSELHLKNTDTRYDSTFGFSAAEQERGIIDVPAVRAFYLANAASLPVDELVGYLEIGGPKLGRDYSDHRLEEHLRVSLRHLKATWTPAVATPAAFTPSPVTVRVPADEVLLAPSLMCADLTHLEESLRRLEAGRVELLHVDLMDGRFTPNMPLGLETLRQLRPLTALPFDVHLMVEDNELFLNLAAEAGANQVSVHVESCRHLDRVLAAGRSRGLRMGVALNPSTSVTALEFVLERLDFVLLMTVNPGFAGQQLVPSGLRKIAETRRWLDQRGYGHVPIEVDGNVSLTHIPAMVAAGAGILVGGTSSIFGRGSLADNLAATRAAVARGLALRHVGGAEAAA